jgi:hypothetical protein
MRFLGIRKNKDYDKQQTTKQSSWLTQATMQPSHQATKQQETLTALF